MPKQVLQCQSDNYLDEVVLTPGSNSFDIQGVQGIMFRSMVDFFNGEPPSSWSFSLK